MTDVTAPTAVLLLLFACSLPFLFCAGKVLAVLIHGEDDLHPVCQIIGWMGVAGLLLAVLGQI